MTKENLRVHLSYYDSNLWTPFISQYKNNKSGKMSPTFSLSSEEEL